MNELQQKILAGCLECIRAWKEDNNGEPIDIHYDDYVNSCYNYGGAAISDMIDELLSDSSDEEQQDFYEEVSYRCEYENRGIRTSVGNRLKYLRKSKGLTSVQLAEMTGMSVSTINKIENGRWSVSLDLIDKIIRAMGVQLIIS